MWHTAERQGRVMLGNIRPLLDASMPKSNIPYAWGYMLAFRHDMQVTEWVLASGQAHVGLTMTICHLQTGMFPVLHWVAACRHRSCLRNVAPGCLLGLLDHTTAAQQSFAYLRTLCACLAPWTAPLALQLNVRHVSVCMLCRLERLGSHRSVSSASSLGMAGSGEGSLDGKLHRRRLAQVQGALYV